MICPKCGGKTGVIDNSSCASSNEEMRKRCCKECGYIFYTVEFIAEYDDYFKKIWWKYHRSKKKGDI